MAREETIDVTARVAPYEGNEDYIFISYSHRDLAEVMPLLCCLKEAGFRFWYDEGIDPGTEWPESIAQHLNRARVCLALLSPDSLDSQNCRREINFALSKNKEFLSVVLRPVQMTPGMEMQISSYQSLLKYKYPQEEAFLKKLLGVELLQSCRQAPPAPAPAAEQPAPAPAAEEPAPAAEKTRAAAQAPRAAKTAPAPAAEEPAPAVEKSVLLAEEPAPAAEPPERKKRPAVSASPLNKRWLAIAAAALAAVAVVWFALGGAVAHFTVGGTTYRDDTSSQRLTGVTLSAAELRKLASFRKCEMLTFTDCVLDGGALPELAKMTGLYALRFVNCQGVNDLSFVNSLPELHYLTARGCGLDDAALPVFAGERLNQVDLRSNALTAVPAFADPARINVLYLGGNALTALEPLGAFTALKRLDITDTGAGSLAMLDGNQNLIELYAGGNAIRDLSPLASCIYLHVLDLHDDPITTLAPLAYCEQLQSVSLRGCRGCAGLDTLAASSQTLTWLDLSDDPELTSLAFLHDFLSLTTLIADNCALTSCAGIRAPGLTRLSLAGNGITDITALADLAELSYLNLADNALEALPPLGGMGSEPVFLHYIFSNNRLQSLQDLPDGNYDYLLVDGNPITKFAGKGSSIAFDCIEGVDMATLSGFTRHYVTSLFIGKQAELEKAFSLIYYVTPPDAYGELVEEDFSLVLAPVDL